MTTNIITLLTQWKHAIPAHSAETRRAWRIESEGKHIQITMMVYQQNVSTRIQKQALVTDISHPTDVLSWLVMDMMSDMEEALKVRKKSNPHGDHRI